MKTLFSLGLVASLLVTAALIFGAPNAVAQPFAGRATAALIPAAAQDNPTAPDVSGSWQISWTAKDGNQRQATMQIKQKGNKLSGDFEGARGSVPLKGTLDENHISVTVKLRRRQLTFTGTVDGEKMRGTTERGAGWSATRQ